MMSNVKQDNTNDRDRQNLNDKAKQKHTGNLVNTHNLIANRTQSTQFHFSTNTTLCQIRYFASCSSIIIVIIIWLPLPQQTH